MQQQSGSRLPLPPRRLHRNLGAQFDEEDLSRDVISATAAISSLARAGRHGDALQLLRRMLRFRLRPNQFTFGTAIHSATALALTDFGKQLHALAAKINLHSDVFVGSSLVDFYGKLGAIQEATSAFSAIICPNVFSHTALLVSLLRQGRSDDARRLFEEMPERNTIFWNAMISGHSKAGQNEEAIKLFVKMCREGTRPSRSTLPAAISAAGNAAALGLGRALHAFSVKLIGEPDAFLGSSLISFYSKCGSPEDAEQVFCNLGAKTLVSWNALICGLAQNGRGRDALKFYRMMIQEEEGLKPNEVTFLGVLSACGHSGLVEEGCEIFRRARSETPEMLRPEHYACVVDMLARHGRFSEAQRFIAETPFNPGIGFWKAMMGGSLVQATERRWAATVADKIEETGSADDGAAYVLLCNVFSAAGMWRRAAAVREEMKHRGVERSPGCSWIEVGGRVETFYNGDQGNPLVVEMCTVLDLCVGSS